MLLNFLNKPLFEVGRSTKTDRDSSQYHQEGSLQCCVVVVFLVKGEEKKATRDELLDMWDHLVWLHEKGKEQAKVSQVLSYFLPIISLDLLVPLTTGHRLCSCLLEYANLKHEKQY